MVEIKGIEKFASKDFPGFISSTVFLGGCNFRCPYCSNADLVLRPAALPTIPLEEFIEYLDSRQGWLEAICLSGGEPLLSDGLEEFLPLIKQRGLLVKLDTNGSFPSILEKLMREHLIDTIAMDVKAPLERYQEVVGVEVRVEDIERSIEMIRNSSLDYMFRTTVVPGIIKAEDVEAIAKMLNGSRLFQLQQFSPVNTLEREYLKKKPFEPRIFEELVRIAQPYFKEVRVEGVTIDET